ncbi:ABC transporter permease [Algicella marina]|uniref:ABC transporter permease subunit n=1 Tax=Algicella marina TaxID=2683284 RepID=A0A6P1T1G8_9RHOB|nr:ABC transporter permease [Algicella marina]QHQ34372.1 ABC transporter permease subunit [Algicella marina]
MRRVDRFALLAAPGLLYLAALYALPLIILLLKSFQGPAGFSLSAYVDFFTDSYDLTVLWRTLRVALLTTLLSLALAYPTAFALARARGLAQTLILVAMILPLSVGVIVKAFAWSILFRSNGLLNQTLMALGITEEPVRMLFTETALIIGAANVFLPFMVLPIYAVIRQIDGALTEAAATLGAGPFFRFFRVTLPLTLPGIIAGSAFTFSLAVSMYVIPSLIVGERQQTLSMLIARSFLYLRDEQTGSTISAILLLIAVAVVVGSSWLASRVSGGRA